MSTTTAQGAQWPVVGPILWGTLSTGLISRDHCRLMSIHDKHNTKIKSTKPMAVCYLNDTFLGAVKALALCTNFNTHFMRMDGNRYDFSDQLFYTVWQAATSPPLDSTSIPRSKVLAHYNNTFTDDAIVVVSYTKENAEKARSLYPITDDNLIAHSSDPVLPE
ncbi:hypothetical protein DFH06DRAFT_1127044 [Mycena polygramma]|nr:hypothetical protein DFH06DRAFT_1127044 [Mycena polygramma]